MGTTTDSPTNDSRVATRTNPLLKTITTATLLLYAMGWGATLAWQSDWDPGMRASYGYQLGWVSCLATCALALLFIRRGHHAHEVASNTSFDAPTSTTEEPA